MPQPEFCGANILVVGGAGFVGSNLVHQLAGGRPRSIYIVVDNLSVSEIENVPVNDRAFISCSVRSRTIGFLSIFRAISTTCFISHAFTVTNRRSPIRSPTTTTIPSPRLKLFEQIERASARLRRWCMQRAGCAVAKKTFGEANRDVGGCAVVARFTTVRIRFPRWSARCMATITSAATSLPFVKARFQNVYGPREILGAGRWRGTVHTVWRNVTPSFILKALHGEALPLDNGGMTAATSSLSRIWSRG